MRGIGRVFKRKGSRFWQIEFWVRGKRCPESSRSIRKQDAEQLLLKRIEQYRLIPGMVPKVTVAQVLDDYLVDLKLRGARAMRIYNRQYALAVQFFGHELAAGVGPRRLYEFQQHLRQSLNARGRLFAPATVNGALAFVRGAFRLGFRNEKVPRLLLFPKALPENNARQGFLEFADYQAILPELPDWAKDPFRMAYYCGWRKMEVLTLRWDEIDLDGKVIRLDPARSKTSEGRTLPFGDIAEVISRRLHDRRPGLPLVFHRDGLRLNGSSYSRAFHAAARRAGRPKLIFHDTRRTAYRDLIRSGNEAKVAREMVGWRSLRMPERYHIVTEADLHDAAERRREYMEKKARVAAAGALLPFEKKGT